MLSNVKMILFRVENWGYGDELLPQSYKCWTYLWLVESDTKLLSLPLQA